MHWMLFKNLYFKLDWWLLFNLVLIFYALIQIFYKMFQTVFERNIFVLPGLKSMMAFRQAYSVASTCSSWHRDITSCINCNWDIMKEIFSVCCESVLQPFAVKREAEKKLLEKCIQNNFMLSIKSSSLMSLRDRLLDVFLSIVIHVSYLPLE